MGESGRQMAREASGIIWRENIMFTTKSPKKEKKWLFEVWFGLASRSQEVYAGASQGFVRAWTLLCMGAHER